MCSKNNLPHKAFEAVREVRNHQICWEGAKLQISDMQQKHKNIFQLEWRKHEKIFKVTIITKQCLFQISCSKFGSQIGHRSEHFQGLWLIMKPSGHVFSPSKKNWTCCLRAVEFQPIKHVVHCWNSANYLGRKLLGQVAYHAAAGLDQHQQWPIANNKFYVQNPRTQKPFTNPMCAIVGLMWPHSPKKNRQFDRNCHRKNLHKTWCWLCTIHCKPPIYKR